MLDAIEYSNRLLLGYLAATEDGLKDSTLDLIIAKALDASHGQEESLRTAFQLALSPVVTKGTARDGLPDCDLPAVVRRAILYQWEKGADLSEHKGEKNEFYSFSKKRQVHQQLAKLALRFWINPDKRPRGPEDYVLIFQSICHLLSSIDPSKLRRWKYEVPRSLLATKRAIEDSDTTDMVRLNFCLYLLTEYLDPTRHSEERPINTEAARLDLLTRLFYVGRSFPEAGSMLTTLPLSVPHTLPFGRQVAGVARQSKPYKARSELERSIYGQIAQCAVRTNRLSLAKSAVESALMWPARPSHEITDLEFQALRLDILIAQGNLSSAMLLAEQTELRAKPHLERLLKTWPRRGQTQERWIELSHFARFTARIAHLYLLRGQLKPAVETLTGMCALLESRKGILASYPPKHRSALSFTIENNRVILCGLGAQVILRSALRGHSVSSIAARHRPEWLQAAEYIGTIPDQKPREYLLDEAVDITLDRHVRIRWRAIKDLTLEKLISNSKVSGGDFDLAKDELQAIGRRFKALDDLIAVKALDGKVGPLPRMRSIQERARNDLFLYSRHRDLGDREAAVELLTNGLWSVQSVLNQASMRRYPLLVVDSLLMSLAAQKEAHHFLTADEKKRFEADLGDNKNFRDDLNRVHELLESTGYRLRWEEYERVVNPSAEGKFRLNDVDAQAWG